MEKAGRPKYDVFISHSSINKNVADAICADFEQHKIKCWYAPRDIMAGESWPSAIKHGIEEAEILILVFSEKANESRQVINEVSLAYNQGKTIIPFKIANTPMNDDFDYFLNRVHWLDAVTQPLEESITAMRKYVENILGYTASLDEKTDSDKEKEASVDLAKEAANRLEEEQNRLNREIEEEKRRMEEAAALKIEAERKRMEEETARRLEEERKRIEAEARQRLADQMKKDELSKQEEVSLKEEAPEEAIQKEPVAPEEATQIEAVAPIEAIQKETVAPMEATQKEIVVPEEATQKEAVIPEEVTQKEEATPKGAARIEDVFHNAEGGMQKWVLPAGIGIALLIVIIVIVAAISKKDRGNQDQVANGSASSERITAESQSAESTTPESSVSESENGTESIVASSDPESKVEEESKSQIKDETESQVPETKIESLDRGAFDYLSVNNLSQGGYAAYSSAANTIYYYWPGKGLIWRDSEGAFLVYEDEHEYCNLRTYVSAAGLNCVEFHYNEHEKGLTSNPSSAVSPMRKDDGNIQFINSSYAVPSIYIKGTALEQSIKNEVGSFKIYRNEKQTRWLVWEAASGSNQEEYRIDDVYHGRMTISGNYIYWAVSSKTIKYVSLDKFGIAVPETIAIDDYINDMASDDKGNVYVITDDVSGYGSNIIKINATGIQDTYHVKKGKAINYYDGCIYFMNTVKETAGYVNKVYRYDFSEVKLLYEMTSKVNYEEICVVPVPGKSFGFILIYGYDQEDQLVCGKGLTNGGGIINGGMEFSSTD